MMTIITSAVGQVEWAEAPQGAGEAPRVVREAKMEETEILPQTVVEAVAVARALEVVRKMMTVGMEVSVGDGQDLTPAGALAVTHRDGAIVRATVSLP